MKEIRQKRFVNLGLGLAISVIGSTFANATGASTPHTPSPTGSEAAGPQAAGRNPEYDAKLKSLATRLGWLSACPRLEKNGRFEHTTEIWYLADTLQAWSQSYASQFANENIASKQDFVVNFGIVIREQLGLSFIPAEANKLGQALADFLEAEQNRLNSSEQKYSGASDFLKKQSEHRGLSEVLSALKELNSKHSTRLFNNRENAKKCVPIRKDSSFWETPNFSAGQQATDKHVVKDKNLIERALINPLQHATDKLLINPVAALADATKRAVMGPDHTPTKPVEGSQSEAPAGGGKVTSELPDVNFGTATMWEKGYYRYNEDGGEFGTARTIWRLKEAGKRLAAQKMVMAVNDISLKNGGEFKPHASHRNGTDVDLMLMMKDGVGGRGTVDSKGYSRDKTFEMVKAMIDVDPKKVTKIFINDPDLRTMIRNYMKNTYKRSILIDYCKGHHNHVHMSWSD